MDIEEIKKITNKVDGWLTDNEGALLYNLAKKCTGKGVIVEIGSWKGKSTILLAKGSKDGNKTKIYAIDHHTGSSEHRLNGNKVWTFDDFKNNIKNAQVDDIIIPIVKTSEQAAKDFNMPVELLFIDGAHEYEFVKQDFELWFPRLINKGIIAFHDTTEWPGPKKVVEESIRNSKYFKNINLIDSITYAQKNQLPKERFRDKFLLFFKKRW